MGLCIFTLNFISSLPHMFFKKRNFTSFQSVNGCLSVYIHNVNPHFHNCCFPNCVCQISSHFLQEHMLILLQMIVYGVLKFTVAMQKSWIFLKSCVPHMWCIHTITWKPSNWLIVRPSSLISIYMNCRVFNQQVTYMNKPESLKRGIACSC